MPALTYDDMALIAFAALLIGAAFGWMIHEIISVRDLDRRLDKRESGR